METPPLSKPILEERLRLCVEMKQLWYHHSFICKHSHREIAGSEKGLNEVLEGQAFQEKPNCIP